MKPISVLSVLTFVCTFLLNNFAHSQTFGTTASAVWLTDCNQSNYFNTSDNGTGLIGPAGNVFNGSSLGIHTQNSGTLFLRGGEVRTFKTPAVANVCSARLHYRIYLQSAAPGAFNVMNLSFADDCDIPSSQFPTGGACLAGEQKWNRVVPDGVTTPYAPINLTAFVPGNYFLEVYYDVSGSSVSTTLCNETVVLNNGGANYKASFTVQAPILNSTNPTTCNGTDGFIKITGLAPGATYAITYFDDGVMAGPASFTADGSGQVFILGLNKGVYSDFQIDINGCTTSLNTGLILSDPVFTPSFFNIAPFCAGSTPPTLPNTSNNGITGTWSPAVINNMASGSYTFTPTSGQCGLTTVKNVVVIQNVVPTFSFGTSRSICSGGSVPVLPNTSTNGYNGTWSPAVVSNLTSGVYTFTPTAGPCATTTTFTVTVNPNVTPTFSFGTAQTYCAGTAMPALPGTSTNGITGTWSPATINNQNSGVYTFTPAAGQCATTTTFTVTINPIVVPSFGFGNSLNICAGDAVPVLYTPSDNAINGTWSPAVINNQNSGSYTFTPSGGTCASSFTLTVTVNQILTPTFSFGTSLTICAGGTVPALPGTSVNGITGTWNPAVVDNQNPGSYTFTPTAGQCAATTTFTVTVNPNITPTFGFGTSQTYCAGSAVPALPGNSTNGITGSWSPAVVDNQNSGVYTFTPAAGQCATTTTFTVTINPVITPTFSFGSSLTICSGGSVPALPGISDNAITGSWSPAVVSNLNSGNYTFTPTAGQCAATFIYSVTVTPNIVPTFSFGTSLTICAGGVVPALPGNSLNGIAGTWSPAVADNMNSGVYTFTPTAGVCATTATFTITVNANVTPVFSFGTAQTYCAGSAVPALVTTSTNGITGSWSPAVVNNQNSGVYTFTPSAGQCATTATFTVTINPVITPVFSFGSSLAICAGGVVPALPNTSVNGITGIWNPSSVSNTNSGVYTFTPDPGQCAATITYTVTVTPNLVPTFSFGTSLTICDGGVVPALPATSTNGITGSWSPAVVDNQNSGVYNFTPDAGQCATATSFTVTVNAIVTPAFSFGNSLTICAGGSVPTLPGTSTNGITGSWSPAIVNNQNSGTYTFTPSAGQCATTFTFTVTVNPNTIPVFGFGTTLSICTGGAVPTLTNTSTNGISGTWDPAVVDNLNSGTYIFTPTVIPGQCVLPASFTVTVNPILTPAFSFGGALNLCSGTTPPSLPVTSTNGISGTWSPAVIDDQTSGTYTFTPSAGQCATGPVSVTITILATPSMGSRSDTTAYDGAVIPASLFTGTPGGLSFTWTNSNPAIGLAASGIGNVPSFTGTNMTANPISGTITVTPVVNGCSGVSRTYIITILPKYKDIFVPTVFSPNADGKNDLLFVYSNYIVKLEMRIFNQWGEQIELITSPTQGWDGKYKGKPQPVGVYAYALQAVMTDGRTVKLKGTITLLR